MKKRAKSKVKKKKAINPVDEAASFAVEQDIAVLLSTLVQKLSAFETKLDAVLNRVMSAPSDAPRTPQAPAPVPERRREHNHLHKAVCADCGEDCELPFKPSANRPVYCRACFAKRKSQRMAQPRGEIRPAITQPQAVPTQKPPEVKKTAASSLKKKPAAKKTKKKSVTPVKKKKAAKKKAVRKKVARKK